MDHVLTLVSGAETTELKSEPVKIEAKALEHGPVAVEVEWEARVFKHEDAEGFKAVVEAWPGKAALVIKQGGAAPMPLPTPTPTPNPGPVPAPEPEPTPEPAPEPAPQVAPAPGDGDNLFEGGVTHIKVDTRRGIVSVTAVAADDGDDGSGDDGSGSGDDGSGGDGSGSGDGGSGDGGSGDGGDTDAITLAGTVSTTDTSGMTVDFTADNHADGSVTIDFGDDATGTNAGDGTTVTSHTYGKPGTYNATATDDDKPERTGKTTVDVTGPVAHPGGGDGDGPATPARRSRR